MSTDIKERFEEILFKIMKLRDLAESDYSMLETLNDEISDLEGAEMSKERQIVVVQKTILKELKNGLSESSIDLDEALLDEERRSKKCGNGKEQG